jgi:hypothetical protein
MRARLSLGLAAAIGIIVGGLASAFAAGSGGTRADYYVSRDAGPTLPRLSVRFDRVIYALSVAGGKYRVFPVMIENPTGAPRLALSRDEDGFTIVADGHEVRGILDLAHADPAMWDGLDSGLRQALLYPAGIEADETHIVYVLAPAAEITGMPTSFIYAIKSLGRPLELVKPAPMAD